MGGSTKSISVAVLVAALGCEPGDDVPVEMGVGVPDAVFLAITDIRVVVHDNIAACSRIRALGGTILDTFQLSLGIPETFTVSAGVRTFEVIALENSTPVAQGCVTQAIEAGQDNIVALELLELPNCGSLAVPTEIELGQIVTGSTNGQPRNFDDGGCSTVGGPESVFAVFLTQDLQFPLQIHVHNDFPGTEYDPVQHARTSCQDDMTNVACSDSGSGDCLFIDVSQPRTIYIVVDSHDGSNGGNYEFMVEQTSN